MTVKVLWYFLKDLCGESDNINRIYDVIQKLFRKKQDGRPMDAHYGKFSRLTEDLRQKFSITYNVKQMQSQWNRLMILAYLSTLDPVYSSARPQIIGALLWAPYRKHHFLKAAIPDVIADTTTATLDGCALVAQGRQTTGGRGGDCVNMKGKGGYTGGRLGGHGGTKGGRGCPRGGRGDGSVAYCYYYKESGHTKYQCPFWKENRREVHMSLPLFQMTSSCDISLSSSRYSVATKHTGSIFLFLFLCHFCSNR